jgi:hypothetical protein
MTVIGRVLCGLWAMPFGAPDVTAIALAATGVAVAIAAFFELLPPRREAQPEPSARP